MHAQNHVMNELGCKCLTMIVLSSIDFISVATGFRFCQFGWILGHFR